MKPNLLINALEESRRLLDEIKRTSNGVINYLRDSFFINDVGNISPDNLECVLEICVAGRDIGNQRGDDPHWLTWDSHASRVLDFTLAIEACLRYDLSIPPSKLNKIKVPDFSLDFLVNLLAPNSISQGKQEATKKTTADTSERTFEYLEFESSNTLFKPHFYKGQFTTKVNSLHGWNRLLENNPKAMNAFYDALAASLQRLNDDSLAEVNRFLTELSIFLNRYIESSDKR